MDQLIHQLKWPCLVRTGVTHLFKNSFVSKESHARHVSRGGDGENQEHRGMGRPELSATGSSLSSSPGIDKSVVSTKRRSHVRVSSERPPMSHREIPAEVCWMMCQCVSRSCKHDASPRVLTVLPLPVLEDAPTKC